MWHASYTSRKRLIGRKSCHGALPKWCATAKYAWRTVRGCAIDSNLSVAQCIMVRLRCYPWRTCLCRATPKYAQAGRPGPILVVAQVLQTCATAKLESVAQPRTVRHTYLAVAHHLGSAPWQLFLPISLFLLVQRHCLE